MGRISRWNFWESASRQLTCNTLYKEISKVSMQELFASSSQPLQLQLPDAELLYYPHFWNTEQADTLYQKLITETHWKEDQITVFGKTYPQPRLTALYGKDTRTYSYSNITMHTHPMSETILSILGKIQTIESHPYNTVLANLYRDGKDSNGWHADNERELGESPRIASASFGEARYFHIKHRKDKQQRFKLLLEHGSLLIMGGDMQKHWLHQIAKTARPKKERINLTFRKLI